MWFVIALLVVAAIGGCIEEIGESAPANVEEKGPIIVNLSELAMNESKAEVAEMEEKYVENVNVSLITKHSAKITWISIIPTESVVAYGTAIESLNSSIVREDKKAHHEVYLIGLEPNTKYYFRILVNLTNGTWRSKVYNFTTLKLEPPQVLNLSVNATHSYVNITWLSERPATTLVKFGTSPEDMKVVYSDNKTSISHSVQIPDLDPGRTYYIKVGGYENYSGHFETEVYQISTKNATIGDTIVKGNLSITPIEFKIRYVDDNGNQWTYVHLSFKNLGESYLKYSIYAAIIDHWGRQFNIIKTSKIGDLSSGILLPKAKRDGFLLFEPVTRESTQNKLIIIYRNYTFEYDFIL